MCGSWGSGVERTLKAKVGVEPAKRGLGEVGLGVDQLVLGLGHVKTAGQSFLETDASAVENALGQVESALGLAALF